MSVSDLLRPNFWDLNCRDLSLSGDLAIGGDMVLDDLHVTSTTDSASTSTGALKVSGGACVAKNLYVGGNVNASGDVSTRNLNMTNTVTVVGVLLSSNTGQGLGTTSMSFVMMMSGAFAFVLLSEFTTSAMSTNGLYIATEVGDVPAAFRPLTDYYAPITVIQNSSRMTGMINISSAGQVSIWGSYTALQLNGYARVSVLYNLY